MTTLATAPEPSVFGIEHSHGETVHAHADGDQPHKHGHDTKDLATYSA